MLLTTIIIIIIIIVIIYIKTSLMFLSNVWFWVAFEDGVA